MRRKDSTNASTQHRYQDSFLLTDDPTRRQTARKEYLESAIRNNLSLRTNSSHKNP